MKKNKGKKNKGNKSKKIRELSIEELSNKYNKKTVAIFGIVERVMQTKGPTIFDVSDGTAILSLTGFVKAGERAYPEIEEGDAVRAEVKIDEFKGELEGEIEKIRKLDDKEKKKLEEKQLSIIKRKARVEEVPFLIKSEILDKLRERFIKAAEQIRLAIFQNRPIIVRHHNDTDGYSAGYALEKAILPLIEKQQGSEKAKWEFFQRAPCMAPFYEIDDSIRDTANSLRNVAKFSNKLPLVVIADNGSSPEDLLGIKQGKVHGIEFIVVDHHYSEEDVISKEVLTHINPFLVNEDGSKFSAGMLCVELARLINKNVENIEQVAALAGFADKIELMNGEDVDSYLEIAKKQGYTKELLSDISTVIDYVSAKVRFMEVREYIKVIFGEPREKQKKLVGLMASHVKELERKGLEIGRANVKKEEIGGRILQSIDIENSFPGFGFYPKPGRAISLIHDFSKEKNLVSIGVMNTAITIRATDEVEFSVHKLIEYLNEKLPNAFVNGGGHKNAGSINFIPNKKQEVLKLFKEFVRK